MMPPESWIGFFEWCEATRIGTLVRESIWLFPVIEAVHLMGLCLLGGSILVVDLRMLGVAMRGREIAELADHARPWLITAIAVLIATGVPLFLSEAIKCFYNTSFWVKMTALPAALIFTFAIRGRRLDGLETSARSRLLAAGSIALWFTVAAAGRWIGYS